MLEKSKNKDEKLSQRYFLQKFLCLQWKNFFEVTLAYRLSCKADTELDK